MDRLVPVAINPGLQTFDWGFMIQVMSGSSDGEGRMGILRNYQCLVQQMMNK